MQDITLQALLEAGCHFGHKSERWHPKASKFIFTEKDGIHIIDLAKTKASLEAAASYVREMVAGGHEVLFVGTKRQAQGVVKAEVDAVGAPYLVERWIGGFLTNWDQIHKNIEKINRMTEEQASGVWKKYPKHEQAKMARYLTRIKVYYGGVLRLNTPPSVLFIVDVRKEDAAVREGRRRGVPIVAIVDTNSDPTDIDYVIPANDDAVGSVSYVTHVIAEAYKEGKEMHQKDLDAAQAQAAAAAEKKAAEEKKEAIKSQKAEDVKLKEEIEREAKKAEAKTKKKE